MEDNDLFDGLDDDLETGSDSDSNEGSDALPADDQGEDGAKGRKRSREDDLMSKWQQEQAKTRRLEAQIAAMQSGSKNDGKPSVPPEVQQWLDAAKETTREKFYESDPRLAEYGIPMAAITGSTPDEMRQSTKTYRELIDAIETKVRNRVMVEHGILADSVGSSSRPPKDYASMSDEEFDRELARATGRRAL